MKLTMEIQGHRSGESDNPRREGEKSTWTTIWGTDTNGRYARAMLYGPTAMALNAKIAAILDPSEVLATKRLVINLEGEWKSKVVKDVTERSFWGKEFNILDGMALEGARLRRDAKIALENAEKFRAGGQLGHAYEAVAQFVANFAGVPLDLDQFMADMVAEDVEFGAIAEANPEALAAAHFARADAVASRSISGLSPKQDTEENGVEAQPEVEGNEVPTEAVEAEAEQAPMDFGSDDGEIGYTGGDNDTDIAEEDAISLDASPVVEEVDVLDDTPASTPAEEPVPAPSRAPPPFAGGRPAFVPQTSFAPQQAKRFERPELPREAPQPSARIAPEVAAEQTERPLPPFMRR